MMVTAGAAIRGPRARRGHVVRSVLLACGWTLVTAAASPGQPEEPKGAASNPGGPGSEKRGERSTGRSERSARSEDARQVDAASERKRDRAQRERWLKLSPEKRKELQAIYAQLKKLPAQRRKLLLERLRQLDSSERRERLRSARERLESDEAWMEGESRRTRRRLLENLPDEVRERLRALPAKERRRHLQRYLAGSRKRLIDNLPPDVAREIRKLPPGQQAARLKQYRTRQVFRRTFQNRREIDGLRNLPARELRRLLAVKDTARPEYLSEPTWRRWKTLRPYERQRILRMVRSGVDDPGSGRPALGRERPRRERASAERKGPRQQRVSPERGRRSPPRTDSR